MRILVTGGGGFLGGAICRALIWRGDEVIAYQRSRAPGLLKLGAQCVQGDLNDIECLNQTARGCDALIHTAGKAGVWGPYEEYYRANVSGTQNVISACRSNAIRHLVYTSSPSVVASRGNLEAVNESVPYPTEYLWHYPHTKALAERMIIAANHGDLNTVSLRPHLIWGPGDNHLLPGLVKRARMKRLRIVGDGQNQVDSVYIDNVVDAHLQAAERLENGAALCGKLRSIGRPASATPIVGAGGFNGKIHLSVHLAA